MAADEEEPAAPHSAGDDGDPVEHLWNAAHEMLRAFRTLIDAADEFVESQRGRATAPGGSEPRERREGRVHHITIEESPGDSSPGAGVA